MTQSEHFLINSIRFMWNYWNAWCLGTMAHCHFMYVHNTPKLQCYSNSTSDTWLIMNILANVLWYWNWPLLEYDPWYCQSGHYIRVVKHDRASISYLIFIEVATFCLFTWHKIKASSNRWPNRHLWKLGTEINQT